MTANRAWKVRANSFTRPDYEIEGVNLRDAIHRGIDKILADVAPWLDVDDVLSMELRWRQDILSGKGGAELNLYVFNEGAMTSLVVWIGSSCEEAPLTIWQRSGISLRIVSTGHREKQSIVA